MWKSLKAALLCTPFVIPDDSKADKETSDRNWVAQIERLQFRLGLEAFGPLVDALGDLITVTRQLIGKTVCATM